MINSKAVVRFLVCFSCDLIISNLEITIFFLFINSIHFVTHLNQFFRFLDYYCVFYIDPVLHRFMETEIPITFSTIATIKKKHYVLVANKVINNHTIF